jgi:nucleoside-diphosphate-sugar epimerase
VERLFRHYGREADLRLLDWAEGDVTDIPSLEEALVQVNVVYHCAAVVSFSPRERDHMYKVNVEGTANLVNCCLAKGDIRLCHVSSVAAIGRKGTAEPIDEGTTWAESEHNSEYGRSKHAAEMEVWRGMEEGLDAFIVNPCIIIGAGAGAKSSERLFTQIDEGLRFYGPGSNAFVDVRDTVRAMRQLMEAGISHERFIVAGGIHPFKTLFDLMADALGRPRTERLLNHRLAEVAWRVFALQGLVTGKAPLITRETIRTAFGTSVYDNSKLLSVLPGFAYRDLTTSVRDMAAVYRVLSV